MIETTTICSKVGLDFSRSAWNWEVGVGVDGSAYRVCSRGSSV